ncbi:MAG: RNA polymerase sigma factor, partial [Acidobacteriota bacterium]
RYRDLVFRLCYRMARDQAEAEDWTQEVFLRIFDKMGSYDGRAKFSTWLYRVTVNFCLDQLKKASRRESSLEVVAEEYSGADPSERLLEKEKRRAVWQELNQLTPDLRTVLILKEFEGLSYAEISRVLDIPEGTVGSRIHEARRILAKRLGYMAGETQ